MVGYGVAGQGIESFLDGNKRAGLNRYEIFVGEDDALIAYDFDNGNSANDAIGILTEGGIANTGLGNDEVLAVGGDSGSPTFLNGEIVGIHSFRVTPGTGGGDAVAGLNGSFGEIGVDVVTSEFADWLDSIYDTEGPQVTAVIVGSTESGSDPDYPVPYGSGEQIRSIPVGGPDEFSVVFDKDVSIQEDDISLIDVDTSNPFSVSGFEYDRDTFTATITLEDPLTGAFQMVLTVNGDNSGDVIDIAGNLLDGEWDNPTDVDQSSSDEFPSGNDSPGGTLEFYLTRLPDSNLNNDVEQGDLDDVLLNWGDPGAFEDGDVNGTGTVQQGDLDQVLMEWRTDFTEWPRGAFLMAGGGGTSGSNLLDALHALDAALTRLGMHDKSTERLLTERRMEQAAYDERAWEALIDDLASALDAQKFDSRGSG